MSHSTVLVISKYKEDVELMLAPYDENIDFDPYFAPLHDWELEHLVGKLGPVYTLADIRAAGLEYEDDLYVEQDGVLGHISTYNPRSKWDWYSIGGRWSGMLVSRDPERTPSRQHWTETNDFTGDPDLMPLKDVSLTDQSRKRYIDWDAMGAKAIADHRKAWVEAHEKYLDEGTRRLIYGIQPDDTKDSYVRRGVGFATFAVLNEDGWHERGSMGWWGVVSDEKDAWPDEFKQLIDEADPDAWFTIVDVHI